MSTTLSDGWAKPAKTDAMTDIVFFIEHFPPHTNGTAQKGKTIADAMMRAQPQTSLRVVTSVAPDQQPADYKVSGLSNSRVPNDSGLTKRLFREIALGIKGSLQLIRRRPDFAIISTPSFLFSAPIALISRLVRVPYVMEIRDLYPDSYADAGMMSRNSMAYRFLAVIARLMFNGSFLIITVTEGIRRGAAKAAGRSDDVVLVHNGYPKFVRDIREEKHNNFTVCFHGTLGYMQDIDTLIQVANRLISEGVTTTVIGSGRKSFQLKGADSINFLGRLGLDATVREVAKCHVGLSLRDDTPVSRDAFPLKVFEYMALGIPVIVTPPSEAGDFVSSRGCGLATESGDVDGIVTAILRMRDDPPYYKQMASAGRAAADGLDRESLADEFVRILHESWRHRLRTLGAGG